MGIISAIYEQLEREKNIKQEINRIRKLYKEFTREKVKVLEGLITEASFMKTALEELRADIIKNGYTELFEQGEQTFNRERPEVKIYTNFIQKYSVCMKQLIDLLPAEEKKVESDALIEFVKKGRIKK